MDTRDCSPISPSCMPWEGPIPRQSLYRKNARNFKSDCWRHAARTPSAEVRAAGAGRRDSTRTTFHYRPRHIRLQTHHASRVLGKQTYPNSANTRRAPTRRPAGQRLGRKSDGQGTRDQMGALRGERVTATAYYGQPRLVLPFPPGLENTSGRNERCAGRARKRHARHGAVSL